MPYIRTGSKVAQPSGSTLQFPHGLFKISISQGSSAVAALPTLPYIQVLGLYKYGSVQQGRGLGRNAD